MFCLFVSVLGSPCRALLNPGGVVTCMTMKEGWVFEDKMFLNGWDWRSKIFLWVSLNNMFLNGSNETKFPKLVHAALFSSVHLKAFKRFLRVLGALLVPLDVFKDHTNPLQGTFLRGKDIWLQGVQNVPPTEYFSKTQPKNIPATKKNTPKGVYLPPLRETRFFKEG